MSLFPYLNQKGGLFGAPAQVHNQDEVTTMDTYWSIEFPKDIDQAVKYFHELEPKSAEDINSGKLKPVYAEYYSVRPIRGNTVKFFENKDNKRNGWTNVQGGKLDGASIFFCTGISILTGSTTVADPANVTDDELAAIPFGSIKAVPQIATGSYKVELGKETVVMENSLLSTHVTDGQLDIRTGYRQIKGQWMVGAQSFAAEASLLSTTGIPSTSFIKIVFHGVAFTE